MKSIAYLVILVIVSMSQGCKFSNPFVSAHAESLPLQYKECVAYKTEFGTADSDRAYMDALVPEVFNDQSLAIILNRQSDLHTAHTAMKYIESISSRTQLRLLSDFTMNDFITVQRISEGRDTDPTMVLAKINTNQNSATMNGPGLCSRLMAASKVESKMPLKTLALPLTDTAPAKNLSTPNLIIPAAPTSTEALPPASVPAANSPASPTAPAATAPAQSSPS